jgi:hypothetical protein
LVFRYDLERSRSPLNDQLLIDNAAVLDELASRGQRHDQPFLLGPDGRPDARVNAFFASPRMLFALAWLRHRFFDVSFAWSLATVTLGGVLISGVSIGLGALLGTSIGA